LQQPQQRVDFPGEHGGFYSYTDSTADPAKIFLKGPLNALFNTEKDFSAIYNIDFSEQTEFL